MPCFCTVKKIISHCDSGKEKRILWEGQMRPLKGREILHPQENPDVTEVMREDKKSPFDLGRGP